MTKSKVDEAVDDYSAAVEPSDPIQDAQVDQSDIILTAATVAVVGVGVAIFEAALLPGVVLVLPLRSCQRRCRILARRLTHYSNRPFATPINSARRRKNSSLRRRSMSTTSSRKRTLRTTRNSAEANPRLRRPLGRVCRRFDFFGVTPVCTPLTRCSRTIPSVFEKLREHRVGVFRVKTKRTETAPTPTESRSISMRVPG